MPKIAEATKLERHQQLVDAAWRCAATRGFNTLTVDDICSEAGVSKGAFYIYFEQKRDLLLSLLDDEDRQFNALLKEVEASGDVGAERIHRLTRAILRWGKDPARQQVRSDIWSELSSDPELRQRFSESISVRRLALRAWIDDGIARGQLRDISSNALAAILLALGDGLMLHAGLNPHGFRWLNIYKTIDALLEGVRSSW